MGEGYSNPCRPAALTLKRDKMKALEKQFTGIGEVRGFVFSQIRATNHGFLYEVNTGNGKHYEVFRKRVNTQYNNISYPRSKAFGRWAWTNKDLAKAHEILDKLNTTDK